MIRAGTGATAAVALLVAAPVAAPAAEVPGGTIELNVSSAFTKRHGLTTNTVEQGKPSAKDRRFTFPITGKAALTTPFDLRLDSPLVASTNSMELKNTKSRG